MTYILPSTFVCTVKARELAKKKEICNEENSNEEYG
jgi:hypothetical protein